MSALANADGGEIYIGIEETARGRRWNGFPNAEAANAHLAVFEQLFPLGDYFDYQLLKTPNHPGLVLKAEIRKTADIRRATNGKAYLRRGAQNLPQESEDQLQRLKLTKGIVSFESETVRDDLVNVTNSLVMIEFLLNIVPSAEPEPWLRKQKLILGDLPTVCCELLYNDEPQVVLPKAAVKIYRYRTSEPEGTRETLEFDPITVEGPAYNLIRNAVARTVEIIEGVPVLGKVGLETKKYPQEAIHEIITNAVIHRDYSINDDIHVRIFDNRIEVQSPGRLPAHITVKNILDERFARNPQLVRLINKFPEPPNKDVGEGLNTAFNAMRRFNLKEPLVTEKDNAVMVTLRHEPLASAEEVIVAYLKEHESINNTKAREICREPSDSKIRKTFTKMITADLIERVPGKSGKAAAYRRAERIRGRKKR
jgi:ATP-dependent DNA helicase RecG